MQLDLYDLLLKGDNRNDVRLMPGDVVFIGAVDNTVEIRGEVNRPAVYEVKSTETYQDIIKMAGGFTANAYRDKTEVKRYASDGIRKALTLNLANEQGLQTKLNNGDAINVLKKTQALAHYVEIVGDVQHPGFIEWKPGLRVADVFQSVDSAFNATADVNYALVVRQKNLQRDIEVQQINLANAILEPGSRDNLTLQSRDRLLIFNRFNYDDFENTDLSDKETENTAKTLEQAQAQTQAKLEQEKQQQINNTVRVVNASALANPSLPRNNSQLHPLSGGQSLEAHPEAKIQFAGQEMTLAEFEKLKQNTRRNLLAPILLQLYQQAQVGMSPQIAEVVGEVKYPGRYPITAAMPVSALLEAAGGLTFNAYTYAQNWRAVKLTLTMSE